MKSMMEATLHDECPIPNPLKEKLDVVLFLAWLFFVSFAARALFSPLMPTIEQDLGLDHSQAGRLFLMHAIGEVVVPFISGWMTSRIRHRGALMVSAWIVGLSLIPMLFIHSYGLMQVFMLILGIGTGLHMPSAMATIAGEVQKSDWGKAMSLHQCIPPLSFIFIPLLATLLIKWFPWRVIVILWGGIGILSAIFYSSRNYGGNFPGQKLNLRLLKQVLGLPGFWIILLLMAMGIGGNLGLYAMLPLYFIHERGMSLAQANTLMGLSLISGFISVFITGWIIDKIGQKATMVCVLLTAAVCTILIGLTRGPIMLGLLFLQAGALSAFMPAAFGALARVAPPSLRSVTNALGPPTSFVLGAGLIPVFIGLVSDHYSFATAIILVGCIMLVIPILVAFLKLGQFDGEPGC